MEQADVLNVLRDSGAFLSGHFKLSSGLHSGHYLQCAALFRFPRPSADLCTDLVKQIRTAGIAFDCVISPALGGVLMGYEVARQANVPNIFAERDAGNAMALRRGFAIEAGQRTLVVEDVITTGGSVKEVKALVQAAGGIVAAVGAIADRSRGKADFGVPFFSLVQLDFPTYEQSQCPLCAAGVPVEKPGS
ncbi:MAG TPA: orotate phosphoribosyltransferase, partial [Acidobacteriota bacterium]|nr:orotate phosphoribosyltransferase [Acidobacteriota bacterium]